jgi:hypothetical protein
MASVLTITESAQPFTLQGIALGVTQLTTTANQVTTRVTTSGTSANYQLQGNTNWIRVNNDGVTTGASIAVGSGSGTVAVVGGPRIGAVTENFYIDPTISRGSLYLAYIATAT